MVTEGVANASVQRKESGSTYLGRSIATVMALYFAPEVMIANHFFGGTRLQCFIREVVFTEVQ